MSASSVSSNGERMPTLFHNKFKDKIASGDPITDPLCAGNNNGTCSQQINGFEYQVQACVDAIKAGKTECPQHPHAAILAVMDIMDELRRQWDLRYPFE